MHHRIYPAMSEIKISPEEGFESSLPRDGKHLDGRNFTIEAVADEACVVISDGVRSAAYKFFRGDRLDLSKLQIKPSYIEAGWFSEAHAVTLTDADGEAIFVPSRGRS